VFEAKGFMLLEHRRVNQAAPSLREFSERTRFRTDTALALISTSEFQEGQAAIEAAAWFSTRDIPRAPRLKNHMRPVECVASMLIHDNHVLADQRKRTKQVMPGAVALPGGHLEAGERPEDAAKSKKNWGLCLSTSSMCARFCIVRKNSGSCIISP
jgi:hypothetical protein